MKRVFKIGTRDSQLALWQANHIAQQLGSMGYNTQIVEIKSLGELNLTSALYQMGIQGIFTKTLDVALLDDKIDLAVHSLKDVPTKLAEGLILAAVPPRATIADCLITKQAITIDSMPEQATIATSSLRRRAQWLNRFKGHATENIRGNINSRLSKLENNPNWLGALFAQVGIERIGLQVPHMLPLPWMLPAPAQGALGLVCRASDRQTIDALSALNHQPSEREVHIERQFLSTLFGGCSMPIGAKAQVFDNQIRFEGVVLTSDGSQKVNIHIDAHIDQWANVGADAAFKLLQQGGQSIVDTFNRGQN